MPSYPRLTRTAHEFEADQSFESITVAGVKIRPVVTRNGADVRVSIEAEVDGQWKEIASRVNP